MIIKTIEGIDIYCLPDCARCGMSGENPTDMDECPIGAFDLSGYVCVPDLCDEYSEEWNVSR